MLASIMFNITHPVQPSSTLRGNSHQSPSVPLPTFLPLVNINERTSFHRSQTIPFQLGGWSALDPPLFIHPYRITRQSKFISISDSREYLAENTRSTFSFDWTFSCISPFQWNFAESSWRMIIQRMWCHTIPTSASFPFYFRRLQFSASSESGTTIKFHGDIECFRRNRKIQKLVQLKMDARKTNNNNN